MTSEPQPRLLSRLRDLQSRPLIRNIAKVISGNIIGNAFNLAAILLLGRVLQERYGILGTLQTSMLLIAQLADLGLNLTLVKYYREEHDTHANPEGAEALMRRLFWLRLLAVGVLGGGALILARPLCRILDLESYLQLFRLGCAGAVANSLWMFAQASMQARERFTQYAVQTTLNHALRLVLIVGLWALGELTVATGFAVIIAVPLVGSAICMRSWPREFWTAAVSERHLRRRLVEIFHFSKYVLIAFITVTISTHAATLQLASLAEMGHIAYYRMAEQLALGFTLITSALTTVLFPKLATARKRDEMRRVIGGVLRSLPLLWMIVFASWIGATVCIPRLLGSPFAASVPVFVVLVSAHCIGLVINTLSLFCYSFGKSQWLMWMNIMQTLVYLALNFLLIPRMAEMGPAVATMIIHIITLGIIIQFTRRLYVIAEK